jgi:hypothetical protein
MLSERALVRRINRKLALEKQQLHVARDLLGGHENPNTGRYYVTDDRRNLIAWHCNLQDLGHELGVMGKEDRTVGQCGFNGGYRQDSA